MPMIHNMDRHKHITVVLKLRIEDEAGSSDPIGFLKNFIHNESINVFAY